MATVTAEGGEKIGKRVSWLQRVLGHELYRAIRGLLTNPLSIIGIVLLSTFILVAIFAPVLAPPRNPKDAYHIPRDGYGPDPRPPMSEWKTREPDLPFWWKPIMGTEHWVHILGTASGQWDIWYGVIWGTRTVLRVGVIITFFSVVIGIIIGSVSAFYGGWVDMVLMRITDIFLAFPFLLAALTLSAVLTPKVGKGIGPAMIAITVFGWMGYARLIRSDILSVREREYVLAARVVGVRDGRILARHIIPNAIFPTLVVASMDMGSIVLSFAGLSFLGVGAEVGYADWGQLLSFARSWITALGRYWYIVVYPGLVLLLYVLSWNLVGDALRDILDPRMRGTR